MCLIGVMRLVVETCALAIVLLEGQHMDEGKEAIPDKIARIIIAVRWAGHSRSGIVVC